MTFHVELLPAAEQDLDRIMGWLNERSPQGATTWYCRWLEVLDDLEVSATTYARAPENAWHDLDLRHVVFKTKHGKPYRVIFTIVERTVFVFCIRGHGQDLVDPSEMTLPD